MDPRPEATRLARAATAALVPAAVAVPLVPVLLTVPVRLRSEADPAFLLQLVCIEAAVLLALGAGALLIRTRLRRTGETSVTRHESWAVLAIVAGGAVSAVGMLGAAATPVSHLAVVLIDGMWTVAVAAGALIVLGVRGLRRAAHDDGPGPEPGSPSRGDGTA